MSINRSEWADEFALSRVILQRIAEKTGQDPLKLPPMYETIDLDALDYLWQSVDPDDSSFKLEFTYAEHRIVVDVDGIVSCRQK